MSDNNNATTSGGVGFLGLLAILFIALKLTGYIAWSWWWVLSPLWIPVGIVLFIYFHNFFGSSFQRNPLTKEFVSDTLR